jgi:hypothetical protein
LVWKKGAEGRSKGEKGEIILERERMQHSVVGNQYTYDMIGEEG